MATLDFDNHGQSSSLLIRIKSLKERLRQIDEDFKDDDGKSTSISFHNQKIPRKLPYIAFPPARSPDSFQ